MREKLHMCLPQAGLPAMAALYLLWDEWFAAYFL